MFFPFGVIIYYNCTYVLRVFLLRCYEMQFYVLTVLISGRQGAPSAPGDGLSTEMKVAIGVGVGATAAGTAVAVVVSSGA